MRNTPGIINRLQTRLSDYGWNVVAFGYLLETFVRLGVITRQERNAIYAAVSGTVATGAYVGTKQLYKAISGMLDRIPKYEDVSNILSIRQNSESSTSQMGKFTNLRRVKKQRTQDGEAITAIGTEKQNREENEKQWEEEDRAGMAAEDKASHDREVVEALTSMMESEKYVTPARSKPTEMEISPDAEPRLSERGKHLRGSLPNLLHQAEAEFQAEESTDMSAPQPVMMMTASSTSSTSTNNGGGQQGTHEPMVKYNVNADATLFTNVRTAYIRGTYYFSMNSLDQSTPVVLKFRLNNCRNIFGNSSLTSQTIQSGTSRLRAKGLSNDMAYQNFSLRNLAAVQTATPTNINDSYLAPFPSTVIGDTAADNSGATTRFSSSGTISDANTRPSWRDWYEGIWQAMHVIETDYRLTFFSGHSIGASGASNNDNSFTCATVFTTTDTTTATTGTNQITPTDARMRDVLQFPYLQQHNIALRDPSSPTNQFYTIEGKWKDSDTAAGGTTLDEQQIKTWYPTGTDYSPAWNVDKTVLAYAGEFSNNFRPCINVKVELQYKVQYRDPIKTYLYPQSNATTANSNLTNKVTRQQLSQELISFITEA